MFEQQPEQNPHQEQMTQNPEAKAINAYLDDFLKKFAQKITQDPKILNQLSMEFDIESVDGSIDAQTKQQLKDLMQKFQDIKLDIAVKGEINDKIYRRNMKVVKWEKATEEEKDRALEAVNEAEEHVKQSIKPIIEQKLK